jgi:hypothetical protein
MEEFFMKEATLHPHTLQVGSTVRLKKECLGNPIGAKGVVYDDYGQGVSVIFENGRYDGFSSEPSVAFGNLSEIEFILFEDSFCLEVSSFRFKSVLSLECDFRMGYFAPAFLVTVT